MSNDGRPWLLQLGLPAVAGSIAVCFTHPLELTKIRLSLDSELAHRGNAGKYTGWFDCVSKNWQRAGVRGLQAGLLLGVFREFFFNGIRIGLFEPFVALTQQANGSHGINTPPSNSEKLIGGLLSGAFGGLCVNPIDICKTRYVSSAQVRLRRTRTLTFTVAQGSSTWR